MPITNPSEKKICKFLFWDKLISSFVCYFAILIAFVILGWLLVTTSTAKFFFNTFNVTFTINLLNNPESQQNFLLNGIFNIVALFGFFSIYCYIFYSLSKTGVKGSFVGEDKKYFPAIIYALIFSAVLSGGIIISYFESYLGPVTLYGCIQILCLAITLVVLLWSALILEKIYPKKYEEYRETIILLDKMLLFKRYDFISLSLFFLVVIGIPFLGIILGFNIICIICFDLMMLFLAGILGTINNLPVGTANINLKSGDEISNVFILDHDENFISFLEDNNKIRKITIDSIENYTEEKLVVGVDINNIIQSVSNFQMSQYQNCEINSNCVVFSRIDLPFILKVCLLSIIMGLFLHPVVNIYISSGWNLITVFINSIILAIPMAIIIHAFYKLYPDNPTI